MQCHNCEKSVTNGGTPDEECLECKCAEYLDNDFKTVTPIDDVSKLQGCVEPTFLEGKCGNGCVKRNKGVSERNREDCEKVLGVFKNCHHSSFKHIACLLAVFMMSGGGAPMLGSVLNGQNLSECASIMGCTRQNASQRWNKMVKDIPVLSELLKSSSKKARKRVTVK